MYIEQLMVEKLSGIIDGESSAYLDELISRDAAVRGRWEQLSKDFGRLGGTHYAEGLDAAAVLSRLRSEIDSRNSVGATESKARVIPVRRLVVAASLAIPLVVAGMLFLSRREAAPLTTASKVADKRVKLYLDDGRVIDLPADGNGMTADVHQVVRDVKLNAANGSLSYTPPKDGADITLNTLVIPATRTYKLTLADGVEVWLNSESSLKFPFSFGKDKREVWVSGEAYFKVPAEAHRPFIVHTAAFDVQVLGTEFNVNTYDTSRVTASLVSGAINARSADGAGMVIKPGYRASYSGGSGFRLARFDSQDLSWINGIYYFDHTFLKDIARAIRRWYGTELVFDDPGTASLQFTGAMFKDKPLKEFLDNLEQTSGIRYTADKGVIHLHAAGRS